MVTEARDLVLGDDALLFIAYLCLSGHQLSQLLGGAVVDPQPIAMTADYQGENVFIQPNGSEERGVLAVESIPVAKYSPLVKM